MEREITAPIDICDSQGRLVREAVGGSRHPLHRCAMPAGLRRVHRWNHWCFTARTHALQITVADVGFLGLAIVSFLDFSRRPLDRICIWPGGLPVQLPDAPRDDVGLRKRRMSLTFGNENGRMRVEARARGSDVDLTVERPAEHETLNVLVPFGDEQFQFTSKQQALPVRGSVRAGGVEYRYGDDGFA